MGVSNYTPTGISHATSVDLSKRSVNQPVHIVQYDKSLPILAVSLYNNGQLYRLSEDMEVSIRLGKPDRTFVYNKALGCDSTRTIVYFEITQQMSLFDGEYYPVIEIMDGDKIANSSTIYLVVDRNPVQHDYIESMVEYKELIDYRDEAVKAGNEAKEAAKVAKESAQTVVDKTKEAVEASETAVNAANSASASAESILGVEENVTRIGNMVSEKEPIITEAAEVASTSATNARQSETNAKASEEAAKLSETNAKSSETKAKASEEAAKLSETNAKDSENESVKYGNLAKSYAVGTDNTIRENDAEDNAKTYCEAAKTSAGNAKQSETNAKTYLDKIIEKVDVTVDAEMSDTSENPVQNKVIKKYVDDHTPEVDDMTGATSTQNGTHGLVPAPKIGDEKKALLGNGTWGSVDAILTYKTKEEYDAAVANNEIPDGAKVIKEYDEEDQTSVIDVDAAMSDTSANPVQNKVIKKYVDKKQVNIDGITLTLDEAKNVIKLADTLKDKIGSALQPESIVNNQITTVEGFALDARQANQNVEGSLGAKIKALNDILNSKKVPTFECNDSIFQNSYFIYPITDGDMDLITPTTEWDERNGGHRVTFKNTQSTNTSFSAGIKIPPHSVVLIDVYSFNQEHILIMSGTLFYNNTDNARTEYIQCKITDTSPNVSCIINMYPIIIKNI